jgi:hypothetical protein
MKRYLPIAAAVVLILVVTFVQGYMTERWATFPELPIFAAQIPKVPMEVGEWRGEKGPATERRILDQGGAVGEELSRIYTNDRNQRVHVFLICGRVSNLYDHEPRRCYPTNGFNKTSDEIVQNIETPGGKAEFKTQSFLKEGPEGHKNIRVYWSFCGQGPWVAPQQDKWSFAGQHALYKLYVTIEGDGTIPADHNAAVDFITEFVPALKLALAPAFNADAAKTPAAETTAAPKESPKA